VLDNLWKLGWRPSSVIIGHFCIRSVAMAMAPENLFNSCATESPYHHLHRSPSSTPMVQYCLLFAHIVEASSLLPLECIVDRERLHFEEATRAKINNRLDVINTIGADWTP